MLETLLLRDKVDSLASRHAARETLDATLLEIRDGLGPVCDDCHRVGWRHERALAVDHVPVTVTIAGSAERDVVLLDRLDERVRVGEVRVGVSATEVRQRLAVLHRGLGQAELLDEDAVGVGAGDTVQAVEEDLERVLVGEEEALDEVEVEDRLEELDVVRDGVDDLDLGGAVGRLADLGQIDLGARRQFLDGADAARRPRRSPIQLRWIQ